jgi:hypothetical protein
MDENALRCSAAISGKNVIALPLSWEKVRVRGLAAEYVLRPFARRAGFPVEEKQ